MKPALMKVGETRLQYLKRARRYCRQQYLTLKEEDRPYYHHVSHYAAKAMERTERKFTDMGTFGVEGFCDQSGRDGCSYLNTGDSYEWTICFRSSTEQFRLCGWADMLETMERQGFRDQGSW